METHVVRLLVPDRPGALGAVASRIGAVGGSVVGIAILERGEGRAVDELVVEMPAADLVELLVSEICQVDGVSVELVEPIAVAIHDPRLDALETAASLVEATTPDQVLEALVSTAARTIGASWAAVVELDSGSVRAAAGVDPESEPDPRLLAAEVAWSPLPGSGLALVLERSGTAFRDLERRHIGALARIADTRLRELDRLRSRRAHPSIGIGAVC